jgi:hypothetical protein
LEHDVRHLPRRPEQQGRAVSPRDETPPKERGKVKYLERLLTTQKCDKAPETKTKQKNKKGVHM